MADWDLKLITTSGRRMYHLTKAWKNQNSKYSFYCSQNIWFYFKVA
jgi:hypothetical protein